MPQILEATKTNAKEAALVAFGVPVVLFDRVSGRLNARLHLDSYVGLAREHGERALDGYSKQVHHVTRGVRSMMRRQAPVTTTAVPASAPEPGAKAAASTRSSSTAPKKRAPQAKSSR